MAGISEVGIWEKDGMYLSFEAGSDVTLGTVVALDAAAVNTVIPGTAALKAVAIGVAIAGYRTSRTATDNVVASGHNVTVATRGVVNVSCTAAAVAVGDYVEAAAGGAVVKSTVAAGSFSYTLGIALTAGNDSVIKVKLLRG